MIKGDIEAKISANPSQRQRFKSENRGSMLEFTVAAIGAKSNFLPLNISDTLGNTPSSNLAFFTGGNVDGDGFDVVGGFG